MHSAVVRCAFCCESGVLENLHAETEEVFVSTNTANASSVAQQAAADTAGATDASSTELNSRAIVSAAGKLFFFGPTPTSTHNVRGRSKHRKGVKDTGVFAHFWCALFSPLTTTTTPLVAGEHTEQEQEQLVRLIDPKSVAAEVKRGRRLRCGVCHKAGASISCWICAKGNFHFPCAVKKGLVEWHWWHNHANRIIHCHEHLDPICELHWPGHENW